MKYIIEYRNEFYAEIKAKTEEEATKKFLSGKCKYKCIGNLWEDYITVFKEESTR